MQLQVMLQEIIDQIDCDLSPSLGIVLGSGLGGVVDLLEDRVTYPYDKLPHFPVCSVKGHVGALHLGTVHGVGVACFEGRFHWYEGAQGHHYMLMLGLLAQLGCTQVLLSNASGSMRESIHPGHLVLIKDHINMQGRSPLIGEHMGPHSKFVGMECVYDEGMRTSLRNAAQEESLVSHEGNYVGVLGPQFETPLEIQMFRGLGGDVVGMSTVPEVIAAKYWRLPVAVASFVTNMASGMSAQVLSHDVTLSMSASISASMKHLLAHYCAHWEVPSVNGA